MRSSVESGPRFGRTSAWDVPPEEADPSWGAPFVERNPAWPGAMTGVLKRGFRFP